MFKPNRKQTILGRAWACATIASLVCFSLVLAASGGLDTSFHGTGKLSMSFAPYQSNWARAVAIQTDGKIVVVGDTSSYPEIHNIYIARFTTTGALDTSFNHTGKVAPALGGKSYGWGVVIDKNTGKIIVAGEKCNSDGSTCGVAVLRYNPNGSLDTSFNGRGYRIDNYGNGADASYRAVALQSDGKIIVGGYLWNFTNKNTDFTISRYTIAGALDTSFNGTGKKSVAFAAGWDDDLAGIAIQPADGKIIVAGYTCDSGTHCNFALARLKPNGSLDTSFNGTGKQTTDFGGGGAEANSIALQSNGKIVLAGYKETEITPGDFSSNFALARYTTNGSLDTGFGGTGKKVLDFSGKHIDNSVNSVSIAPTTGKIVICGNSNHDFALARLTTAGTFDTTFNGTGKVSIDFGGNDSCHALAIQPKDGKYVVAGSLTDILALARVLP